MKKFLLFIPFLFVLLALNHATATETAWGTYEFTIHDTKFSGSLPAISASKDPVNFHSYEFSGALPGTFWAKRSTNRVVIGSVVNPEDPNLEMSISLTVQKSPWGNLDIFQDIGREDALKLGRKFTLIRNGYEHTGASYGANVIFTTAIWFKGYSLILKVTGPAALVRSDARAILDSLLINGQKLP